MIKKEDIFQFPNAKWALPFFASHPDFCFKYVDLLKNTIGDYSFIECVYGSPACKMNGGHAGRKIDEDKYLDEINEWNKRGISVWVTFSNYLVTLNDFIKDNKSFSIMKRLHENNIKYGTKNGIILSADTLIKYIRYQYPDLTIIASVVWFARENLPYSKEMYLEKLNKTDKFCISYQHNDKIDEIIKDFGNISYNCEIILNNLCYIGCNLIENCYLWQSKKSLGLATTHTDLDLGPRCPASRLRDNGIVIPKEKSTHITYENTKKLADAGFILKLAGRVYNLTAFKLTIYGWMLTINYRDIIENILYGACDKTIEEYSDIDE